MTVNLNNWFERGITFGEYEKGLTDHEEDYYKIYDKFTLPDDAEFLKQVKTSNLRAFIIAEPWCGHCMLNLPIFKNLAEQADTDTRVCLRATHQELMDA